MRKGSGFVLTSLLCAAFGGGVYLGNREYGAWMKTGNGKPEETDVFLLKTYPDHRDIRLNAVDGLKLHAVYIPSGPDSHEYVIVLRDVRQTSSDMASFLEHYTQAGKHVVLPDLRGSGKSEGANYGYGYDDRLDVLSWIHWILKQDHRAHILLHGLGTGANACLLTGMEHIPQAVYAIISDTAFTTLRAYLIRRLDDADSLLPVFLRLLLLRIVTRVRAGYDIYQVSPLNAVKTLTVPTLFLHGDADKTVPAEMCKKLYNEAGCARQIGVFLGAGHLQSEPTQRERYWKQADAFLLRHHPDRL